MHCRFHAGHGTFANAVVLRQHYDRQHAHEYQPGKVAERGSCSKCGQELQRQSIYSHRKQRHSGDKSAVFVPASAERIQRVPVPVVVDRRSDGHTASDPQPMWEPSADDVVLPVIELLAQPGSMVPVAHLAALFTWRDATAAMLKAVGREA
jgi:hypothetical protein